MIKNLRNIVLTAAAALSLNGCYGNWDNDFRETKYYTDDKTKTSVVQKLEKINTSYEEPFFVHQGHVTFIDNGLDGKVDYVIVQRTANMYNLGKTLYEITDNFVPSSTELIVKDDIGTTKRTILNTDRKRTIFQQGKDWYSDDTCLGRNHPEAIVIQKEFDKARSDYDVWRKSSLSKRFNDWEFNGEKYKINKIPDNVWNASLLGK